MRAEVEDESVPTSWGLLLEEIGLFTCVTEKPAGGRSGRTAKSGPAQPSVSPPRSRDRKSVV